MTMLKRCALILLVAGLMGCASDQGGARKPVAGMNAPKQPPPPPPEVAKPLDPSLRAAAVAELNAALANPEKYVRANAIEAMQVTQGASYKVVFIKGLSDPLPLIRYASARAIGRLQIAEAHDQLEGMLHDPDTNVQIWVRFALHRLGDKRYSKELQQFAQTPLIWQFRAQVAEALGQLNEPSAVRVLRPMLTDPEAPVRIQAAEALYRLGEPDGLKGLVGGTTSAFADDQMLALLGLAARGENRVSGHVRAFLTADWPEVALVAARAMGMLGSPDGYAIAAAGVKSADARQRSLGALALGAIGRSDAQNLLAPLLKDDAADVRLSAAQALLQLKPPRGA